MKEFETYALHISNNVRKIDGKGLQAWIAPVRFKSLYYIIDPRYLEGDQTSKMAQVANNRNTSVNSLLKLFWRARQTLKHRI